MQYRYNLIIYFQISTEDDQLSALELIHHWLAVIHAHSAQTNENVDNKDADLNLTPPVFIVGTHVDEIPVDDRTDVVISVNYVFHLGISRS